MQKKKLTDDIFAQIRSIKIVSFVQKLLINTEKGIPTEIPLALFKNIKPLEVVFFSPSIKAARLPDPNKLTFEVEVKEDILTGIFTLPVGMTIWIKHGYLIDQIEKNKMDREKSYYYSPDEKRQLFAPSGCKLYCEIHRV